MNSQLIMQLCSTNLFLTTFASNSKPTESSENLSINILGYDLEPLYT